MKSPPPWPLQNKSFPPTPCSLNLSDFRSLLCFLLLCNQGVQSQPPDFNNNWGGREEANQMGWGWLKGEVLTFCRERGFMKLQTAFISKMSWFSNWGDIFLGCYCFVFSSNRKYT